jgi:hypothetical protein
MDAKTAHSGPGNGHFASKYEQKGQFSEEVVLIPLTLRNRKVATFGDFHR